MNDRLEYTGPRDAAEHAESLRGFVLLLVAARVALGSELARTASKNLGQRSRAEIQTRTRQWDPGGNPQQAADHAESSIESAVRLTTAVPKDYLVAHLSDSLSPEARTSGRNLVLSSASALFVAVSTGAVGSQISILGMTFAQEGRGWVIGALLVANVYFLLSFFFYRMPAREKQTALLRNATIHVNRVSMAVDALADDADRLSEDLLPERRTILVWCEETQLQMKRHRTAIRIGRWRAWFDTSLPVLIGALGIAVAALWFPATRWWPVLQHTQSPAPGSAGR